MLHLVCFYEPALACILNKMQNKVKKKKKKKDAVVHGPKALRG